MADGAYAADVNLDSSASKDAAVDCSTTWHMGQKRVPEKNFQSRIRFEPQKRLGGMLVLKNRQHEI